MVYFRRVSILLFFFFICLFSSRSYCASTVIKDDGTNYNYYPVTFETSSTTVSAVMPVLKGYKNFVVCSPSWTSSVVYATVYYYKNDTVITNGVSYRTLQTGNVLHFYMHADYYMTFNLSPTTGSILSSSTWQFSDVTEERYFSTFKQGNFYPSFPIYKYDDTLFIPARLSSVHYPEIITPLEDLQTLNYYSLAVNTNDFNEDDVYLMLYDTTLGYNKDNPNGLILLNTSSWYYQTQISSPGNDAIYYIPISQLGVRFIRGHSYQINFALREQVSGGGGFRDDVTYTYEYIGDTTTFTVPLDLSDSVIGSYDDNYKDNQQQQQTDAIENQTSQSQQFYDDFLSDDYDENVIGDNLNGLTDSTDDIDYSIYSGLFTTIFSKFSSAISGDYNTPEVINIPIPFSKGNLKISSDILYNIIKGTFLYTFLQVVWYFIFGMYIFKFSNNLVRSIKSGNILNGFENNNEVITSSML